MSLYDGGCKVCGQAIFIDGYHVCVTCAIEEIEKRRKSAAKKPCTCWDNGPCRGASGLGEGWYCQKESTTMYDPMTADRPEARQPPDRQEIIAEITRLLVKNMRTLPDLNAMTNGDLGMLLGKCLADDKANSAKDGQGVAKAATVGFMEAMEAARGGKRVRRCDGILKTGWWHWGNKELTSEAGGSITVHEANLDARWEIEQPPAQTYTFLQAVEMMKAGKLMKPQSWGSARSVWLDEHGRMATQWGQSAQLHTVAYLMEPWVEATPG